MQKVQFDSWGIGYDADKNAIRLLVTPSHSSNLPRDQDILFFLDAGNITDVLDAWYKSGVTSVAIKGQPIERAKFIETSAGPDFDGYEMVSYEGLEYTVNDSHAHISQFFVGQPEDFEVSCFDLSLQKEMFREIFYYPATDWILLASTVKA